MQRLLFVGVAMLFVAAAGSAWADVPRAVKQQGRVMVDEVTPLDGSFPVTFALYDEFANEVWRERYPFVSFVNGYYTETLGERVCANDVDCAEGATCENALCALPEPTQRLAYVLLHHDRLTLRVSIDTGGAPIEFWNSQELGAVPYAIGALQATEALVAGEAMRADFATSAGEASAAFDVLCSTCIDTSELANQSVTTGKIAANAIDASHVPDHALPASKIEGAVYTAKEAVDSNQATLVVAPGMVSTVVAACDDANDLALFGECDVGAAEQVNLVNFKLQNVSSASAAATYACTYRSYAAASTITVTARIYCLPVD